MPRRTATHAPVTQVPSGRPVFSPIAWGILAPFFITAYGGFDQVATGAQLPIGLGVAVVVHLVLLPVFLLAGAVERRLVGRPWGHAGWIGFVILLIGVGRPMLISTLHGVIGFPPVETAPWIRVLLNSVVIGLSVIVIWLVIRAVDRRAAVAARLDAVLAGSARGAQATAAATRRLIAEFEREIAEPVRLAIESARVRPFDAVAQGKALRKVAHDVVRPLSHHVFATEPIAEPQESSPARRPRLRRPKRVLPATAWSPAAVFTGVMYPTALIGYGPLDGLQRLVPAALVALVGSWLIGYIRIRNRPWQLAALAASYLVIGVLLAAFFLDMSVLPLPSPDPRIEGDILLAYWGYIPVAFLVIATLMVVARTELAEARELEAELADSLLASEREAAAARLEHAATRNRLARVLHNHVQGEIIALDLRLRLGSAGEREVDALGGDVERMLAEAITPPDDEAERLTAEEMATNARLALDSWSQALEVRSESTPEVWEWLAARPEAAAIILDAAAEGLTNAVRHDEATSAHLDFARVGDGVRLTLRAPGRLRGASADGFGLADLRRRGAEVELGQVGREVVLSVAVAAA